MHPEREGIDFNIVSSDSSLLIKFPCSKPCPNKANITIVDQNMENLLHVKGS